MPFRGISRFALPWWLTSGDGGKIAYSIELLIDASLQRLRDGLTQGFPTTAGDTAIKLIGAARLIPRGRSETRDHYAKRLLAWRWPRGHRVRGNAFALLEQVSEYFGGLYCAVVDVKRNYRSRDLDGTEHFSYGHSWNWDGTTTPKSRFWLVIDPRIQSIGVGRTYLQPAQPFTKYATLDEPFADPLASLGVKSVSRLDVEAIRNLFRGSHAWKPSGTRHEWAVIAFGDTPVPDGLWARWSKNVEGSQVLARDPLFRYWFLRGDDLYAGDPANYPADMTIADGTQYAGAPTAFAATITLFGGASYAGDPTAFPLTVRIPDDS